MVLVTRCCGSVADDANLSYFLACIFETSALLSVSAVFISAPGLCLTTISTSFSAASHQTP